MNFFIINVFLELRKRKSNLISVIEFAALQFYCASVETILRVRGGVRMWKLSTSIHCHFQHLYLSTLLLSTMVSDCFEKWKGLKFGRKSENFGRMCLIWL